MPLAKKIATFVLEANSLSITATAARNVTRVDLKHWKIKAAARFVLLVSSLPTQAIVSVLLARLVLFRTLARPSFAPSVPPESIKAL